MSLNVLECPNCHAMVPALGKSSDGRQFCCVHCCFNPLGCRCKYGEIGIEETRPDYAFDGTGDEDDREDGTDPMNT